MIKAIIFDMDGLLVDSEPLWRQAEQEIFGSLGLQLNEEELAETTGIRLDEVVRIRHRQHPWPSPDLPAVEAQITDRLIELIEQQAEPLPGAANLMDRIEARGLRKSLASSSPIRIIEATMKKFGWTERMEVLQSAEGLALGKPHPEVYLRTAERMAVEARLCLAFEDSVPGVISAKAAGMKCVAVPEGPGPYKAAYGAADLTLGSLTEFSDEVWKDLEGR